MKRHCTVQNPNGGMRFPTEYSDRYFFAWKIYFSLQYIDRRSRPVGSALLDHGAFLKVSTKLVRMIAFVNLCMYAALRLKNVVYIVW